MILLLLAIGVHPPELQLEAMPGEQVELTLLLLGDEQVTVRGAEPLIIEEQLKLKGVTRTRIPAKIPASTRPGNYETYIYIVPENKESVVAASAVRVHANISAPEERAELIGGTAALSSRNLLSRAGVGLLAAVATIGILFSIRIQRRKS